MEAGLGTHPHQVHGGSWPPASSTCLYSAKWRSMRLGKAVAITASVLMAGGLVLSGIAPASAATAGTELTLSIKQLPASVFDTAKVPSNELGTCLAALGSKATTAATRLDW